MQQQIMMPELTVPKEPPPEFEFIAEPPSISGLDL
jgi:splicing factor 3A subunit 1